MTSSTLDWADIALEIIHERADQDLHDAIQLDPWLTSDAQEFAALVGTVEGRLKALGRHKRWKAARSQNLSLLMAALFLGHHRQPGKPTKYSRANGAYIGSSATRPAHLSAKALCAIVDGLHDLGLVRTRRGFRANDEHPASMSLIWPTTALQRLWEGHGIDRWMIRSNAPVIELRTTRNRDGKRSIVEPPSATAWGFDPWKNANDLVREVNRYLAEVMIWIPEEHRTVRLPLDGEDEPPRSIDLADKSLRRIFNNVRPEDHNLDQGGRWYGAWWLSLRSGSRTHITINGEPTIELDYSGLHPRMIYHQAGLPFVGDPYLLADFPGGEVVEDPDEFRQATKVITNVLINSTARQMAEALRRPQEQVLAKWEISLPRGITLADMVTAIRGAHPQIADALGRGRGIFLQAQDAELCGSILERGMGADIPILPVHDSFIVRRRDEAALRCLMEDEYHQRFGFRPVIRAKSGHPQGPLSGVSMKEGSKKEVFDDSWSSGYEMTDQLYNKTMR
jgi:hypothetical protein